MTIPSSCKIAAVILVFIAMQAEAQIPAESQCLLPWGQITIIGDSLTSCGYDPGVRRDLCWAEYLRLYSGCHISNLAKGGAAAAYWRGSDPISNAYCNTVSGPCLGIIWLGDVGEYQLWVNGVTTAGGFRPSVVSQVDRLLEIGTDSVIVIRPSTVSSLDVLPDSFAFREFLSTQLQEICDENPLVDCIDLRDKCAAPGMYPVGGIHPTGAGQLCFFQEVLFGILNSGR